MLNFIVFYCDSVKSKNNSVPKKRIKPYAFCIFRISIKQKILENVEKNKLLRFIALGMDSMKIIYNLEKLKTLKNKYLDGNTGYLQLDDFNKLRRNLKIVRFKNGIAREISF